MLWLAPEGVIGTLARYCPPHRSGAAAKASDVASAAFLVRRRRARTRLTVNGIGIAFGGVKAATDVSFAAAPGRITSVIGPNGAGKTTVLNMIGGFYRPDTGSIRLGDVELAGAPAWRIARAGIARTYQTTQLFGAMSVLDNVLVALRRGRLGNPCRPAPQPRDDRAAAEALLAFVGYHGALAAPRERPAACRPPPGRDRARARDAAARAAARRARRRPDARRQGGARARCSAASPTSASPSSWSSTTWRW